MSKTLDKYFRVVDEFLANGGKKGPAWKKYNPKCKNHAAGTISFDRMLKNAKVVEYLESSRKEVEEIAQFTKSDMLIFLRDALTLDPTIIFSKLNEKKIAINDLKKLPGNVRVLIKTIKPTKYGLEVAFFSKERAVEIINRMLGYNEPDKIKITREFENMTDAELDDEIAKYQGEKGED